MEKVYLLELDKTVLGVFKTREKAEERRDAYYKQYGFSSGIFVYDYDVE